MCQDEVVLGPTRLKRYKSAAKLKFGLRWARLLPAAISQLIPCHSLFGGMTGE
jgi:hypothetical protein